jgi:hypothetical protein
MGAASPSAHAGTTAFGVEPCGCQLANGSIIGAPLPFAIELAKVGNPRN